MDLREALDAIAARLGDLFRTAFGAGPAEPPLEFGADVDAQLFSHRSGLFLGLYDEASAARALEERGVLPALRARIGADLRLRLYPDDDIVRVVLAGRPEGPEAIVVELKARLVHGTSDPAAKHAGFPALELLAIDWMLLQNPLKPFPRGRRALPGQRFPGLGLGQEVVGTLVRIARRLGAGGLIGIPMYYHTAVLYHRLFAYVDPVEEGRFQALRRDLGDLSLEGAAFAVAEGRVRDAGTGAPLAWEGREMVFPLGEPVRGYLANPAYADDAARALLATRFVVEAPRIC